MSSEQSHGNIRQRNAQDMLTPISSPKLQLQDAAPTTPPSSQDNRVADYIPASILQRLTPVSPQKKRSLLSEHRNKVLEERTRRLAEHSSKVELIHMRQKSYLEKKRRYSNESLQRKLDDAHKRRLQSYSAKSKRASESLKLISNDDSVPKSVRNTKTILKDCCVGIIADEEHHYKPQRSIVEKTINQYILKKRIATVLNSNLFEMVINPASKGNLIATITSSEVTNAVSSIFRILELPQYTANDGKYFLQSFLYMVESYKNTAIMNSLVTTLPKIADREPYNTIFNNKVNADIIAVLIKSSSRLIMAFKFLIQSNLNKLGHPYLLFNRLWKNFHNINSIFLSFHAIRSIVNLNCSVEILLRSQRMLELKTHDYAYRTIKKELLDDICKYDSDISNLKKQISVFKLHARQPTLKDIYFTIDQLKQGKKNYNVHDLFPSFVNSMQNWRMVLLDEEFTTALAIDKDPCHILNNNYKSDNFYLQKYYRYCALLQLENFAETLSMDQDLVEFGIRICDFSNNSLNAERVFPPLNLSVETFNEFFEMITTHGFSDIMSSEFKRNFNDELEIQVERQKQFLIELVKKSIILIISSNLPINRILFEKYQFNKDFEILSCPLLVERGLALLQDDQTVENLIVEEVCSFVEDPKYSMIETLQIFKLLISQHILPIMKDLNEPEKLRQYLTGQVLHSDLLSLKLELIKLNRLMTKLVDLNVVCYKQGYFEIFEYLKNNFM